MKKAPVGKSHGMKDPKPAKPGLGGLHKAGKSVPLFNASRIDKLSETGKSKTMKK